MPESNYEFNSVVAEALRLTKDTNKVFRMKNKRMLQASAQVAATLALAIAVREADHAPAA